MSWSQQCTNMLTTLTDIQWNYLVLLWKKNLLLFSGKNIWRRLWLCLISKLNGTRKVFSLLDTNNLQTALKFIQYRFPQKPWIARWIEVSIFYLMKLKMLIFLIFSLSDRWSIYRPIWELIFCMQLSISYGTSRTRQSFHRMKITIMIIKRTILVFNFLW